MIIKINTPVSIEINELTDLEKLGNFMKDNNLKINKSKLARQLNIDRRTVSKYLAGFKKSKHRNKPSSLDSYYAVITELLSSNTQIFHYRRVLYQYLVDNHGLDVPEPTFYHYLKSIPEFDDYFKKCKVSNSSSNPIIRFETLPGEQAQIDWKESVPFVLADTGEVIAVNVLVMVLASSRLKLFRIAVDMTQDTLLHLLVECFEEIDGVPRTLLTDNMKTVMDAARTQYHKGKVNSKFDAFARDFGFEVVPCRAHTPKTKGKVESQMKVLDEIEAYSGKLNLVELHELVASINTRVNNTLCQGTGRIPLLDFQKEKDSLSPLPHESIRNQYRIKTKQVKVNPAAMISVKSNLYSVPPEYIGKTVNYQLHDSNIYVYFNTKLIAVHYLSNRKLNYSHEHYRDILSCTYVGKDIDEISEIAKHNLEIIGGAYE